MLLNVVARLAVVPVEAERLQSLAMQYFHQHRRSLYEQIISEELALHNNNKNAAAAAAATGNDDISISRVVDITENFVALVPFASSGPYVILLLPRFHATGNQQQQQQGSSLSLLDSSDFTTLTPDLIDECATILHSCLKRLHVLLDEPDFNLVVQTAPVPQRGVQAAICASTFFKWHIRITPRLGAGAMAGFELGSGLFSNSHLPEDDAELRQVVSLL
jgi:UDPglucose--hexose-1-phosphate uridylyltransferase